MHRWTVLLALLAVLLFSSGNAGAASFQTNSADLEGASVLSEFDSNCLVAGGACSSTLPAPAQSTETAYSITRSLKAVTTAPGQAAISSWGSGSHTVSWTQGDSGWIGFALYIAPGYYAAHTHSTTIFQTANPTQRSAGQDLARLIVAIHASGQLRVQRVVKPAPGSTRLSSVSGLVSPTADFGGGAPGKLAEGRWYWLSLHLTLDSRDGSALTELYVDDVLRGSSTLHNVYASSVVLDRARFGIAATNDNTTTTIYEDRMRTGASQVTQVNPPLACGSAVFCATYEDTWAPWDAFNGSPNGGIGNFGDVAQLPHFTFASDPVNEGAKSFKAYVDGSAAAGGQAGQRSLMQTWPAINTSGPSGIDTNNKSKGYQGSEAWYRSRMYFPMDFDPQPNSSFNWVMEWHDWPDYACCAHISMGVITDNEDGGPTDNVNGRLSVRILGGGDSSHPAQYPGSGCGNPQFNVNSDPPPTGFVRTWYQGPTLTRGHWYDVLMHVKWDYTTNGLVEYWLDGTKRITYNGPTLYWYEYRHQDPNGCPITADGPGPGQSYWMEGYYRSIGDQAESVYHDAAMIGPTQASVSAAGPLGSSGPSALVVGAGVFGAALVIGGSAAALRQR
jgi:hypothetical protein